MFLRFGIRLVGLFLLRFVVGLGLRFRVFLMLE